MNRRLLALVAWLFATLAEALPQAAPSGTSGSALGGMAITTSLAPGTVALPGDLIEFTVSATNSHPTRATLRLLDPPPGCVFTANDRWAKAGRLAPLGSGRYLVAAGKVRWLVPSNSGGLRQLTLRAIDVANPASSVQSTVEVRVEGESAATTIAIGDVTGDGVQDTIAGARLAAVGGVLRAGAVYLWEGGTAPSAVPTATLVAPGAATDNQLGLAWKGQGIQLADVSGDGVLDIVVGSYRADIAGVPGVGAIFVWLGGASLSGTPAPHATLSIPGAPSWSNLGFRSGQGIQLADVTGDGVLDVISGALGSVTGGAHYVWKGGPTLQGAPSPLATLSVSGAGVSDLLGMSMTQLIDVTGDGVLDVVAGSPYADAGGVVDSGVVYVWRGGATLVGSPSPLATLAIPGAVPGSMLGYVGDPYDPIYLIAPGRVGRIADVTNDGIPDLVIGAIYATVGGVPSAGAIYVWKGGAALKGTPTPLATLTVPGAQLGDRLGMIGVGLGFSGHGIHLADVTGDGLLDVIAAASQADVAGVVDAGAIHVWQGGSTLVGALAPFATLAIPSAVAGDQLGGALGQGLLIADLTGDGVVDVLAGSRNADVGGVADTGAIYVWSGGASIAGAPSPLATLTVPSAMAYDYLGSTLLLTFPMPSGLSIQIADVTGDGLLDVVAGTVDADVIAGKSDGGAIYVWSGGASLTGSIGPLATLYAQSGNTDDVLGGSNEHAQGIQLVDLTSDGVLDIVALSMGYDIGGVQDVGAVFVWSGGSTLSGTPLPLAELRASNRARLDMLGKGYGQPVQFADVTGDGVTDVLTCAQNKNVKGVKDAGAILVWVGGPAFSGTIDQSAAFADSGANASDFLGSAVHQGYYVADITGDGTLDVIAGSPWVDAGSAFTVGALYVWQGGAGVVGSPALLVKPMVPGASASDALTY